MLSPSNRNRSAHRRHILTLCHIALGAALLAVCAWVTVPLPWGVPVTLQTLAVFALVGLLGTRCALCAMGVYLALGAVGVPVFAGFGGGVGVLLGATGGYLIGFLPAMLIAGVLMRHLPDRLWATLLAMAAGMVVCYAVGTAWFVLVYAHGTGGVGVGTALTWCVLPYLIPDTVKIAVAALLTRRGRVWVR